jgi:hypothetical protein
MHPTPTQDLVIKKLPDQNYVVLKFLVEFISLVRRSEHNVEIVRPVQVVDRCDMNKMTAANLAVVFGPNLAWSNDKTMVRVVVSMMVVSMMVVSMMVVSMMVASMMLYKTYLFAESDEHRPHQCIHGIPLF